MTSRRCSDDDNNAEGWCCDRNGDDHGMALLWTVMTHGGGGLRFFSSLNQDSTSGEGDIVEEMKVVQQWWFLF